MIKNFLIKLNAAFLLFVFGLNTMVGFACAFGLDMGFNRHHHHELAEPALYIYAHIGKHHGENEAGKYHHTETQFSKEIKNHSKSKDGKDNCCTNEVTKLAQIDKSIPLPKKVPINPIFLNAFESTFNITDVLYLSQTTVSIKQFVRSYHPPIPDIRIVIQSFQI